MNRPEIPTQEAHIITKPDLICQAIKWKFFLPNDPIRAILVKKHANRPLKNVCFTFLGIDILPLLGPFLTISGPQRAVFWKNQGEI